MNSLSHAIRRFNRFELKYFLTMHQAEKFKAALKPYLSLDENGSGDGSYALASLYYDSPDLRCYHEKVDGVKYRRKLRIRHYETDEALTPETPVFVEIKQRIDRVTQKRRVLLPYEQALNLCNERQAPVCAPEDRAVVDEIHTFLWQYNLRPTSIVRYVRQAFVGTDYDIGLRITFDTELMCQPEALCLHEQPASLPMFPAEYVVMEVKVNERIPYWLTELIGSQNLSLVRISKYCRSIELSHSIPIQIGQMVLS